MKDESKVYLSGSIIKKIKNVGSSNLGDRHYLSNDVNVIIIERFLNPNKI
jgi:hypothetical protein